MDLFHRIALEEYAKALLEGKALDSDYVKQKVYERYEWELKQNVGGISGLNGQKTQDIIPTTNIKHVRNVEK